MVQDQQFESNMLHLARLTDPPRTGKKKNLTVCNLPELLEDGALKQELSALLEVVKRKTEFCRDWRNRHFAHRDLALALQDGKANPLEQVTKEMFFEALRAVSDLLNAVERFFFRGGCSFESIAPHEGVGTLLWVLGFGVRERERLPERMAQCCDFTKLDLPETA